MNIHTHKVSMIKVNDWDKFVEETYNRPYSFQQQDGCKSRGIHPLTVPEEDPYDFEKDTIPEEVNGNTMGVSFKAWLARNPTQKLSSKNDQFDWLRRLFWERNFYPDVNMIANDLYNKGLLDAGEYIINIDW